MPFRLGRSRGSSPREVAADRAYLPSPSSPAADQVFDAGCIRNQVSPSFGRVDFEHVQQPNKEMAETNVEVPQFLPALDPLSDPSSDEYESSPEHHHQNHYGRRHRHYQHHKNKQKLGASPHQKLLSVFNRHKQNQPQDADSVALGIARGAAQAHADSNSNGRSNEEPDSNGFLNILLGEHAQIMGQLQQHDSNREAHPVYATPTKKKKDADKKFSTPPPPPPAPAMSSLQRRLAQNSTDKKASSTPPLSSLQRRLAQNSTDKKSSSTPPPPVMSSLQRRLAQNSTNKKSSSTPTPPPPPVISSLQRRLAQMRQPAPAAVTPTKPIVQSRAVQEAATSSTPNHRRRTQWSPPTAAALVTIATNVDDEDDDYEAEEEAEEEESTILPYYEACDEVVNRLGIGRPRYGDAATVDSPVKVARSVGTGAIPPSTVADVADIAASTTTATPSESPVKVARIMGCGVIPTIPEEDDEDEEEDTEGEDTFVRRLTFDLPEDMDIAASDNAGSKAGRFVGCGGGRDDGTVSLLSAGSALSSYRRAAEKASSSAVPPPKSSLQRALLDLPTKAEESSATTNKPSSLQRALAASKPADPSSGTDALQPSTPNRSNLTTKSRSLGAGAMTLDEDEDKAAGVDASASRRRVRIATVPAVERVALPARGGAGIVPAAPAEAAAESRALTKGEVSRHTERRRTASSSHRQSAVYLLLLDPTQKIFELCSIRFDPATSTVGSVIDRIARHATEPGLASLKYSALVRPGDGTVLSRIKDDYKCAPIKDGEVLVAVPECEEPSKCQQIANPILADPKLKKLLKRARQHREKSRRGTGSRSRGKGTSSSSRGKSKSRSLENQPSTCRSSRSKDDARNGGRPTTSEDKLKRRPSPDQVKPNTPPTSPGDSSFSPPSPSVEDFRKAAVDAASFAATQAVEGRISNLEKRIADSQERDTRFRRDLEKDLRLQVEARAKVREDIEEHLRLKGEQNAAEVAKPAHLRIEELAKKAKAETSIVASPGEATLEQEEVFFDQAIQKAKRTFAKVSRRTDVDSDSIKTLTLCLGAAVALRFALWAVAHVVGSFFGCLQHLFSPAHASYELEMYVPTLASPYGPTEGGTEAFGLTGILVLTCFFAVLMVAQKSVEEKKRTRRMHSSPRKRIRSLIHSPGNNITSASSYHIGSGTMSPRKVPKGPWSRHY